MDLSFSNVITEFELLKYHNSSQISERFLGADAMVKTVNKRNDSSTGKDRDLMSEDSTPR